MTHLLPCPFCGSNDIDPEFWLSKDRSGPGCNHCDATADNDAAWNTRASGWRSDMENAPKDGRRILTFAADALHDAWAVGHFIASPGPGEPETWRDDGHEPTHWMPLPPSPEGAT